MSFSSLQSAIEGRAEELMGETLLSVGVSHHVRRKGGWRTCPCSYCSLKREATEVIGTVPYGYWRGEYVADLRDAYREKKRKEYREKLALEKVSI